MKSRRSFLLVTGASVLGILGAQWARRRSNSDHALVREHITISAAKYLLSAPIYLASAKNYFAANGLDVRLRETAAGILSLQELLAGRADLATVAELPVIRAVTAGMPLSVIAILGTTDADDAVLARVDHGIAAFADLKGKKIGLSRGTTSEYYLDRLSVALGMTQDQFQVVDIDAARIVQTFVEGEVDAIVTWSPYLSQAQDRLGARAILLVKDELVMTNWMLVSSPAYVRSHPGAVKAVLRALLFAEDMLLRTPDEGRLVTARAMGIAPRALDRAWPACRFEMTLDQSLIVALEQRSRWVMAKHYVQIEKIPNFLSVIDFSFLQDVGPDRVQIIH